MISFIFDLLLLVGAVAVVISLIHYRVHYGEWR